MSDEKKKSGFFLSTKGGNDDASAEKERVNQIGLENQTMSGEHDGVRRCRSHTCPVDHVTVGVIPER